jgi:regulator of protease activity HflC (stomatin/prohibitin superfamily)
MAMVMQVPARPDQEVASRPIAETAAWSAPGVRVLVIGSAAVLVAVGLFILSVAGPDSAKGPLILLAVVVYVPGEMCFHGLTSVVAGEARVIQVFGQYRGTVRTPGLQYVNPFARKRRRVSVRIRNHESALAKVNDADGNPIEIAAVVVWRVTDTARALYAVDNFAEFVAIQTDTAVRHIASVYPYISHREGELSLRDNAEEITARLSAEIADRVRPAGVAVIESRLTQLSYAPEIAQAMLRQQQATAVIGARQQIVEGAVGMVRLALQRLETEGVVDLDEERKAAMVSNLLVVLCSEQATQQVVNTGSLYQ